ncbi:MAG: tetratricopeptide repeat protein [Acidobacteriota bacterium]|nr:MAG: tetratricopeptide repeat protein [Acidobacteriota bacterium]
MADETLRAGTTPLAHAYELYLGAHELGAAGRLDEARKLLEQVLELDPGAARVRSTLARLCLRLGDGLCAEQEAHRAVELAPDNADGHLLLAEISLSRYRRRREPASLEEAVAHLRRAADAEPRDMAPWTYLIRVLGSEGRFEEAEQEARRAAAVPGVDPAAPWLALARALVAGGAVEQAIALLDDLDVTGRAAIPLLEMLADLKGDRQDVAGQVEVLERLSRLRAEDAQVAYRLGMGRLELGDSYGSVSALELALSLRPGDPAIRRDLARALVSMGRGEEALDLLEGTPDLLVTPHLLVVWAQAAEQAGSWRLAAEKFEEVAADLRRQDRADLSPAFQVRAARNWLRADQPRRALQLIEDIEEDAVVLRLRLKAMRALGRDEPARRILAQRRASGPDDPVLVALEIDFEAERLGDASALDRALELLMPLPQQDMAAAHVARILTRWSRAGLAAGLLDAIGMPQQPEPLVLRARAETLHAAGRLGEAEAAFRRLLEDDPDNDAVLNDLGYLLATAGRSLDEAIGMLEKALRARPEEPAYLDSLGWALHRSGRSDEALPLLQRAVRGATEASLAEIREHLGDVYQALGDVDRAVAEWRAAVGLSRLDGSVPPERLQEKIERHEPLPSAR